MYPVETSGTAATATATATAAPAAIATEPGQRPGSPLDLRRVLAELRRWRLVFAVVAVAGLGAGIVIAKTLVPRLFEAKAVLVWDGDRPGTLTPGRELQTIIDGVKVLPNLQRLRRELGISATLESISKRIEVRIASSSNVLQLRAQGNEAEEVLALSSALVRMFIEQRTSDEQTLARERVTVLSAQEEKARKLLGKMRKAFDDYRRATGFTDVAAERLAAISEAATLRAEAQRSLAEAASEETRRSVLDTSSVALPREVLLSENETKPAARKAAELEVELVATRAGLSARHPRALALEAELSALRGRPGTADVLRAERVLGRNPQRDHLRTSMRSAKALGAAARTKGTAMRASASAAVARAERLSEAEGRASELLADVRGAETHLAELVAKLQRSLDDARHPAPRFRVAAEPVLPDRPSKSYRRIVAVATPVLLLFFALGAFVLRVAWRLRAHTPQEIAYWSRTPVVASTSWPREPWSFAAFSDELAAELRAAPGRTVLIPFGADETRVLPLLRQRFSSELEAGALAIAQWPLRAGTDAGAQLGCGSLRPLARAHARALVLVAGGVHAMGALDELLPRLGRSEGVGVAVIALSPAYAHFADRAGDARSFWRHAG